MTTQVNSVEISSEFIELASLWHGGQGDMLYAVASTGGLTMGSLQPRGCDTPEKWYLHLWQALAADVMWARRAAEKSHHEDFADLERFEGFCDATVARLAKEYGLEDWENS